ncbi:universal stress protein [Streptomyces sp. NPDC056121]|uniref:universal stress protein n=1 Tax=unclassified Streptomyces TaxID=2593676 RepID=UPI0030C96A4D
MDHHITVGLDGSLESTAAARWAAREAELRGVELRITHAEEWLSPLGVAPAASEIRREWAEALLSESADALRRDHPRLGITKQSVDGPPAPSLVTAASTADMLVLGSRALGTVAGFVLGSVGMAVLQATEQPVVLVRRSGDALPNPDGEQPGGLVVGVDIGVPCDDLLAFAFAEASCRSCRLHVLHVCQPPPLFGYGGAYDPGVYAEVKERATTNLLDTVKPWRDKFPTVEVAVRTPVAHAAHTLVGAGAEADLIVVGRRIRPSPRGPHIGSTTHAVIHHATAPVAVVAHD